MELSKSVSTAAIAAVEEPKIDFEKKKQEIVETAKTSREVSAIVKGVNLSDTNGLVQFGNEAALEISKLSDKILKQMQLVKVEDSGQMLAQLTNIMSRFDPKDFEDDRPKGFLEKIFKKTKDSLEALFRKYNSMGDEVEKVSIIIRTYESEIKKSNETLDEMFKENMRYYTMLQHYIVAGEMCLEEINGSMIPQLEDKVNSPGGTNEDRLQLNNLIQARDAFSQRVYDLKLAENVAMQAMPSLQNIKFSNVNLIRKINSAFIVTLPIFKSCLIQAIMLKRQKVQSDAMVALDSATEELFRRNAENTARQSVEIAKLASGSSISVETLVNSWQTIVNGIEETKRVQEEAFNERKNGESRLLEIKEDFNKRFVI